MLYIQILETSLMALHYFLIGFDSDIMYMLQEIFLMLLVTMVFHFFSCELGKMTDTITTHKLISTPLLVVNSFYVLGLSLASIVLSVKDKFVFECDNWIWLYSAVYGIIVSIILVVLALKMNQKLKEMSSLNLAQVSKSRHAQLW